MKRRINSTGRQRMTRSHVTIRTREDSGQTWLEADLSFEGLDLPPDAAVYVEAYRGSFYERYAFGTVGCPGTTTDIQLPDFAGSGILFRVKVVDETTKKGLLLAAADRVRACVDGETKDSVTPILPTRFETLDFRIWELEFNEAGPVLILNQDVPDIRSLAQADPTFMFAAYPAIVERILLQVYFIDGLDEQPDDWVATWLAFARQFVDGEPPAAGSPEVEQWIGRVVREFCRSQRRTWTRVLSRRNGE